MNALINNYAEYQKQKEREFEDICRRCGSCCGAHDDPCIHLMRQPGGTFACDIYPLRKGYHRTRAGKIFKCVSIRDIVHREWPGRWNCAYRKQRFHHIDY